MKKANKIIIIMALVLSFGAAGSAQEDMCHNIKSLIVSGHDASIVVQTSIDLGVSPCETVRCAFEGRGGLELIIHGAFKANVSPDVVAQCLIDAGAGADDIEGVYQKRNAMGESYSPYDEAPAPSVVFGLPGEAGSGSGGVVTGPSPYDNGGGIVSPYTF